MRQLLLSLLAAQRTFQKKAFPSSFHSRPNVSRPLLTRCHFCAGIVNVRRPRSSRNSMRASPSAVTTRQSRSRPFASDRPSVPSRVRLLPRNRRVGPTPPQQASNSATSFSRCGPGGSAMSFSSRRATSFGVSVLGDLGLPPTGCQINAHADRERALVPRRAAPRLNRR
jgi:hypothetical protein